MNLPAAPPHPADVEFWEASREMLEIEARYLRLRSMMWHAYRAGFESSWPGEWDGPTQKSEAS